MELVQIRAVERLGGAVWYSRTSPECIDSAESMTPMKVEDPVQELSLAGTIDACLLSGAPKVRRLNGAGPLVYRRERLDRGSSTID
jgi:hypothetical protein